MRRVVSLCACLILAAIVMAGCGGSAAKISLLETKPLSDTQTLSPQGFNHFVNANLLEMYGAYADALSEYEKALRYIPTSVIIRTDYAELLYRSQRPYDALAVARPIEPKSSSVYLLIANCYRLLAQPDSAIPAYQTAVALDSLNMDALWYLAGFYRESGQADSAIAAYYRLVRVSDTYYLWQELATQLGKAGRYAEALTAFQKSVDLKSDKSNIGALMGLAATYDALDSLARAEETIDRAIALDPYDVRIYRQMSAMYVARRDVKKAIMASEKLASLLPSDWMVHRRLGVLLYSDSQLDKADSLFRSRIEAGDEDALNYFYRGRVAIEQGRLDDAKSFFERTVEKENTFVDGWLNLAFAYREMDSIGMAISALQRGLPSCTENMDRIRLLYSLGSIEERNGQYDSAVIVFQQLLSIDSNYTPALNYLGYMLAEKGDRLPYAQTLIERALAHDSANGAYLDSYGWVLFKQGNYDKALVQLKRAAEVITTDPVVHDHLGDTYRAMGDEAEARRQYEKALQIDPENAAIKGKLGR
ncbi:MAG: tetratricopeptide repeat protein [candidate division Zixibacteria bacterium]|nr:tetratricopeptide repeat protein [candidate division Zixibacteria bacterium]